MNNNLLSTAHLDLCKKCFDYLKNLIKIVECNMDLEFLLTYLIKKEVCCDSIFVYVPEKYYDCDNQSWKDYIIDDVKNNFEKDIGNNYKNSFNDDPYGAYILYCVTDVNKCSNNKNYKVLYIGMSGEGENQIQGVFGRLTNSRSYIDCCGKYIDSRSKESKIENFINNALCCRCEGKKLGVALLLVKKNDVDTAKELEKVLCEAYYRKNSENPPAQSICPKLDKPG